MEIKFIDFKIIGDERGGLIALEENLSIPFDIKRVYYIFDNKNGIRRGLHTHKKLRQVLISISGSCKILLDDGIKRTDILLDSKDKGLLVEPFIWHEMYDFSPDSILMVLASDFYDESDYIRSYQDFIKIVRK